MDDLVLLDTKNQTWKDDKSRFGFKMLQKMGWREDKGLGKNDSGSVASIKVSKREEGLGLGMEKVKSSTKIHSKSNCEHKVISSVAFRSRTVRVPSDGTPPQTLSTRF